VAEPAKGKSEELIAPMSGLGRLRFHDLSHHAVRELAETASSDQLIRSKRNVTRETLQEVPAPQVFQNAGGDDGTRTRGLMRDRRKRWIADGFQ
jgi:hypothetical protein